MDHETFGQYVRRTGYNVMHANTIAAERDAAIAERDRAVENSRKSIILGISGIISTGVTGIIVGIKRRMTYESILESKNAEYNRSIKQLSDRLKEIEAKTRGIK